MRALIIVAAAAVGFVAGYFVMLNNIPQILMSGAMERIVARSGGWNQFVHPGLPDETSRRVVRPSPDLAYSACVIDLADGPVRITSPMPDRYWSLSFFDANTDVPGIAQREEFGDEADIIIATREQADGEDFDGARVIVSPTRRGIAITRMFAGERSDYGEIRTRVQTAATCGPLSPAP